MPQAPDRIVESGGGVTIVAANLSLIAIALDGVALAEALGVDEPLSWPPEYNGPEMFAWVRALMARHPGEPAYATWFIIGAGRLCGTAGFKGPPDAEGSVEIGYSVVQGDRRKGFATQTVALLTTRAFADPRVTTIKAETLPAGLASQQVLLKSGFVPAGSRVDPDDGPVLCFERRRKAIG